MAACTPRKLVHWAAENNITEFSFGSPYSDTGSSESTNTTSTLQYLNSQLVAHGFTRSPGLSFDGLSKEDGERLTKCMLGMLSQRMEDMSRAEEFSTKLRTLSYEHERLTSMHRTTSEQLAAAERDTNLFKSRLAATSKALQASESAHKATSVELQRTRSSLQSVRQTHTAELKRREKETEKMVERWTKISDAQVKLGATASGLRFNATHAYANTTDSAGKAKGLLEEALEEADTARRELVSENLSLKNVVLSVANELARAAHTARQRLTGSDDEVPHFTISDIFSLGVPESAAERIHGLLMTLREAVTQIGVDFDPDSTTPSGPPPGTEGPSNVRKSDNEGHREAKEIARLQNNIVDLRRQLEQAQTQKQSGTYADQAQAIVRRFVNDDADKSDSGVHVEERLFLEKVRKDLDNARMRVDEAALRLKDEKEAMEEERQAFYQERRLWKSQMGFPPDDDPPAEKPASELDAYFNAPMEPLPLPLSPPKPLRKSKKLKSPRKSTAKPTAGCRSPAKPTFAVGKVGLASGKRGRGSTSKKPNANLLGASTSKPKVIPPMETEVMPVAPLFSTRPGGMGSVPSQSLIVPNAFVLPPPSPLASIPPQQDLLSSLKPMGTLSLGAAAGTGPTSGAASSSLSDGQQASETPSTPPASIRRPFPVAKPLAQHMIHAYSPARPSPLSRILMLANSPAETVPDEENNGHQPESNNDADPVGSDGGPAPSCVPPIVLSLEEELGLEESTSDESPLRDKHIRMANKSNGGKAHVSRGAKDKGKATVSSRSAKASRDIEKENAALNSRNMQSQGLGSVPAVKHSAVVKPLGAGKGGARRVPIGSADAAPMGPGWK